MSLYGGKSRAVYEYTLPQGSFSIESDEGHLLGCMTIDVPYHAQLTVLDGNRRSGEYTVVESREPTDVYVDKVLLPRGENGAPVLVDRIYLCAYEVAGETKRMAATLYFDYEGFPAGYGASEAAPKTIETADGPLEVIELPSGEFAVRSSRFDGFPALIPALVCLAMFCWFC